MERKLIIKTDDPEMVAQLRGVIDSTGFVKVSIDGLERMCGLQRMELENRAGGRHLKVELWMNSAAPSGADNPSS